MEATEPSAGASGKRDDRSPPPEVWSVSQTAKALGRGETTVYGLIKSGRLKARKLGHNTIISPEDVRELINSCPVIGSEGVDPVRTPDRRRKQAA